MAKFYAQSRALDNFLVPTIRIIPFCVSILGFPYLNEAKRVQVNCQCLGARHWTLRRSVRRMHIPDSMPLPIMQNSQIDKSLITHIQAHSNKVSGTKKQVSMSYKNWVGPTFIVTVAKYKLLNLQLCKNLLNECIYIIISKLPIAIL